jgi:predicted RNA-binding protein with EMAP domain
MITKKAFLYFEGTKKYPPNVRGRKRKRKITELKSIASIVADLSYFYILYCFEIID